MKDKKKKFPPRFWVLFDTNDDWASAGSTKEVAIEYASDYEFSGEIRLLIKVEKYNFVEYVRKDLAKK